MKNKEKRPVWIRLLSATSSLALIGATTYVIIAGFNLVAFLVLISSFGGVAGPAVMAADSAIECVTGFFEILLEGVLSIFKIIGDIFGSIFG
ncbi:hypothetical protein [Microbulbifer sp. M83]|uniref:hypothetical protein n=1 Tax=Microbulbifer sp. M83 TaxID=3118246 RepID=UPI002FE0FEE0